MSPSHDNLLRSSISTAVLFSMFSFSFYIISTTSFGAAVIQFLQLLIPITWSMELVYVILFLLITICLLWKRKEGWDLGVTFSWLMLALPVLSYSLLDPLKALNFPITFAFFKPSVPYFALIAAGIVVATGSIYLTNEDYLWNLRASLLSRGASTEELDTAIWKNYRYVSMLVLAACACTFGVSFLFTFSGGYLSSVVSLIPLSIYLVPILATIILSLVLLLYLYERGKLLQKGPKVGENHG
jgi:hypothetical protein